MTSHDIMDQTPFRSASSAVEWYQRTSDVDARSEVAEPSALTVEFTPSSALTRMTRGFADDEELTNPASDARSVPDPLSKRENDTRIRLLARKHAGVALNVEDEARLAIATERVRLLIPRVTAADMEYLAAKFDKLQQISERLEDLKRGIEDDL